jgi:putative salt-induced outer membrane protein
MKKILAIALLSALTSHAAAQWKGAGELGLAITGGNTDTQNINGRLGLLNESEAWKHEATLGFLRAETLDIETANRYDLGWTSGYKLTDVSYIFGSVRYDNDDFGPFADQIVGALGYGFYPIKNDDTTLLLEAGLGYKRVQPQDLIVAVGTPPNLVRVSQDTEGEGIFRGKVDFAHKLTTTTQLFNTTLLEIGPDNKYYQNDLGVAVKMSEAFAVKLGFQLRHNDPEVLPPGIRKTDRLFTTNLVYSF